MDLDVTFETDGTPPLINFGDESLNPEGRRQNGHLINLRVG